MYTYFRTEVHPTCIDLNKSLCNTETCIQTSADLLQVCSAQPAYCQLIHFPTNRDFNVYKYRAKIVMLIIEFQFSMLLEAVLRVYVLGAALDRYTWIINIPLNTLNTLNKH